MADEQNALLKRVLEEVVSGRDLLGRRIDDVQERVETLRNQTLSNFDGTFQRLERIESGTSSVAAALARVEVAVDGERSRRSELRQELIVLRERLEKLERRLEDLDADSAEPH
jgi:phage shock protein A